MLSIESVFSNMNLILSSTNDSQDVMEDSADADAGGPSQHMLGPTQAWGSPGCSPTQPFDPSEDHV